jgi:RNA polymerase sigma-70 factor (ECF subfamily)
MRRHGKTHESDDSTAGDAQDGALVRRIARWDRSAFDQLYRSYRWRLLRFIGQLAPGKHLIEEILDDTMLVVWRKAGSYNGQSRVSTWIFGIAYREMLRAKKRDGRALQLPLAGGELASTPSVEADFIDGESSSRLHQLVSRLSEDQRLVVELTYFHGFDYKEIAATIGCPLNTVKTRMFHARRRLKALLTAGPDG